MTTAGNQKCHAVMLVCCHSVMLVCCHSGLLSFCNTGLLSCCLCQMLNVTHWDMLNNFCHLPWLKVIFHRYEVTFLYVKVLNIDPWDMANNFCFHVKAQNSFIYLFIFHGQRPSSMALSWYMVINQGKINVLSCA